MFRSARLKLTLWYLLIIMIISFAFSFFIYQVLLSEVQRFADLQQARIQRQIYENQFLPPGYRIQVQLPSDFSDKLVEDTEQRLFFVLFIINGSIFILAGGLGYFLAGRTLRPIQEMLSEQNRFISDSSHEFRTPLTSLKTALEVSLRDKQLKLAEAKNILAESIEEVNKLQALSDGLLQLAQYQKPSSNLKFETVSLQSIIQKSIKNVSSMAEKKSITIQNQIVDTPFEGSQYSLTDLFVILLDNAIKYSPAEKKIIISSRVKSNFVQIFVQDQGIGVDPKDIPHLFDRFYRADAARSKESVGGYGLGLSIAKKIVESHRGFILVKKNVEDGSTFIVQLPLKQTFMKTPRLFS